MYVHVFFSAKNARKFIKKKKCMHIHGATTYACMTCGPQFQQGLKAAIFEWWGTSRRGMTFLVCFSSRRVAVSASLCIRYLARNLSVCSWSVEPALISSALCVASTSCTWSRYSTCKQRCKLPDQVMTWNLSELISHDLLLWSQPRSVQNVRSSILRSSVAPSAAQAGRFWESWLRWNCVCPHPLCHQKLWCQPLTQEYRYLLKQSSEATRRVSSEQTCGNIMETEVDGIWSHFAEYHVPTCLSDELVHVHSVQSAPVNAGLPFLERKGWCAQGACEAGSCISASSIAWAEVAGTLQSAIALPALVAGAAGKWGCGGGGDHGAYKARERAFLFPLPLTKVASATRRRRLLGGVSGGVALVTIAVAPAGVSSTAPTSHSFAWCSLQSLSLESWVRYTPAKMNTVSLPLPMLRNHLELNRLSLSSHSLCYPKVYNRTT